MAANIFNQSDCQSILQRINSLSADNNNKEKKWGKMNLNQMLENCSIQLTLALAERIANTFENGHHCKQYLC